jgi:hypothetical protein
MHAATNGLAEARTIRSGGSAEITFRPHDGELEFGFVLAGEARLAADAFVVPPGQAWAIRDTSADFRLLHVTTSRLG